MGLTGGPVRVLLLMEESLLLSLLIVLFLFFATQRVPLYAKDDNSVKYIKHLKYQS